MSPLLEEAYYATASTSSITPLNGLSYSLHDIATPRYEPVAVIDVIMGRIDDLLQNEARFTSDRKPSLHAVHCIRRLLSSANISPAFREPAVSSFDAELDLTWKNGRKQITILCGDGTPQIHYYEQCANGQTRAALISNASGDDLAHWFRWLQE